jgi:AcrR family transcriptional regulator
MTGTSPAARPGLRERKKAHTRATIEDAALRLFLERGYDQVTLDEICEEAMVSLRTFFRYFTSKEDLVLGRLRDHLGLAERLFSQRAADEPVLDAMRAVITVVTRDYSTDPRQQLTRLQLATTTPALQIGLLGVLSGFERVICDFAAPRLAAAGPPHRARLLAAAAVTAFRVALQTWLDTNGTSDLPALFLEDLDALTQGLR